MDKTELKTELESDVKSYLKVIFNDHYEEIPEIVIYEIVENVIETSAFKDEGCYNDDDIRLAFRRVTVNFYAFGARYMPQTCKNTINM